MKYVNFDMVLEDNGKPILLSDVSNIYWKIFKPQLVIRDIYDRS